MTDGSGSTGRTSDGTDDGADTRGDEDPRGGDRRRDEEDPRGPEAEERRTGTDRRKEPPETAEHPTEGVHHRPEPDADNLIPAEDEPGTF